MPGQVGLMIRHVIWLVALLMAACSSTKQLVVLLPEDDGNVGSIAIANGDRTVVLDKPLAAARINTQGRVKPDVVSEAEVQQTFAQALSAQPPKSVRFLLYFEPGTTVVAPASQTTLEALFAEVARRQAVEVEITGHTDRLGQVEDNDRLALERAQAVRDMLIQQGLQASFIRAVGRGEREPLIPTPDEQEESRNRRVEVIVR